MNSRPSGRTLSTSCSRSHCAAKRVDSARERGSAIIRFTCRSKTAGVAERAVAADLQQLLIRQRAPQEERQPRREIDVGDAIAAVAGLRRLLDAEHEARVGEDPLDAEPDPVVEVAAVVARLRRRR